MKLRQTILSHSVVFAVGLSIAFIATRSATSDPNQAGEGAQNAPRRAAGAAGASDEDGRRPTARSAAEARSAARSNRSSGTPTEQLTDISRIGDPLARQAALMDLLARLGPDEFPAVAEQFRNLDHFSGAGGEYELILRAWTKADPMAALEHAIALPDGRGETRTVLSSWAIQDPAAAEEWARANHSGDGPNPYLAAVIRGLATQDVNRATLLASSMPDSGERRDAIESISRALLVKGADEAIVFAGTIEDPAIRGNFISSIANRLGAKDPAKAADWIASMTSPDDQNRAARNVANALARQAPQNAATWVAQLQPAARAEAARGVIPAMSSGDIEGTARWISTLQGVPNYDQVVEEYVWSCDQRAPEQSAAWIRAVADTAQQTRLYHRMLGEWARRDAAAVKNWVANNPVPDTVARRFR